MTTPIRVLFPLSEMEINTVLETRHAERLESAANLDSFPPDSTLGTFRRTLLVRDVGGDALIRGHLQTHPYLRLSREVWWWWNVEVNGTDADTGKEVPSVFSQEEIEQAEEEGLSMAPWLRRALRAIQDVDFDLAFNIIRDLNTALGGIVPGQLDLNTEMWSDVAFIGGGEWVS